MKTDETRRTFDLLANHWATDSFYAVDGIWQHERALAFAPRSGVALDIGCGSNGRIINLLKQHNFLVDAIDISTEMLRLAKIIHPDIRYYHVDIVEWKLPRIYDFISAWDSVWHVPLEHQHSVITKICSNLKPEGVVIFTTAGLVDPAEHTNIYMNTPIYHATPGIPSILRIIDDCHCVCRHLEYDQNNDSHLFIVAQKY